MEEGELCDETHCRSFEIEEDDTTCSPGENETPFVE